MIHIASQGSGSSASNIDEDMISPNAIDMRIDRVFLISDSVFEIDEDNKRHRDRVQVFQDQDGYFNLDVGAYDIALSSDVSIAENEAGWLVIRSTFNRNGVFITSGIYDAGYNGNVGGVLHVTVGPIRVKHNTRVAQFVLFQAETVKQYDGDYGRSADGTDKPMEQGLYSA